MAQTGFTPIQIYSSSTAASAPVAGNLTNSTLGSELAINITDGKLFYKDNANVIQVIGWKTVPTTAGGTGLTSYTAGDLLYYASGTTLTKLAIGASGRYLSSSGTAPQWTAPAALTKTDDTNVTLTLGGSASTALLNAASLTLGWTGQLATSRGGTGLSSFTANGVLYASSTSALATGSALVFDGTNFGVGIASPAAKLHVNDTAAASAGVAAAVIRQNGGSGNNGMVVDVTNTPGVYVADFRIGNSSVLRIDDAGGLILAGSTAQKATGTTWSNPSDQLLKDNIRDYSKGIAELMQIRVREWEYNGKGGTVQGTKGLGVVADEVMVVLPDTVSTYNAKLNSDDENVTAIKKFDATEITWLLVKAIQEQQQQISNLKIEIDALKDLKG